MQLIQQPVGTARSCSPFVDPLVFDVRAFTDISRKWSSHPTKQQLLFMVPRQEIRRRYFKHRPPKPLAVGAGSEDAQRRSLTEFIAVSDAWSCSVFLKIIFFC
ncbi:hypothetical protein AVEN_137459-1 [Araneus ventricosus]|uniref:Uncharacterized protein n=1 Tax=Araneus ventricosus TaxID=182803 RepID=A0A4Y2LV89_ARAVE|nr:hypothetical protein AVEN_137459-1 [Araneus ventricosus]